MSHSKILAKWNFSTNNDSVPCNGEKLHIEIEFHQLSRNNMHVRVPEKLLAIHSKVTLILNPVVKVLKCFLYILYLNTKTGIFLSIEEQQDIKM